MGLIFTSVKCRSDTQRSWQPIQRLWQQKALSAFSEKRSSDSDFSHSEKGKVNFFCREDVLSGFAEVWSKRLHTLRDLVVRQDIAE